MSFSLQTLSEQLSGLVVADAAAGAEAAASAPTIPAVRTTDYAVRGYHLEVIVRPEQVVIVARALQEREFVLDTITGVDWLGQDQMEVVYDFFHHSAGWRVVVRSRLPRSRPEAPTISGVFPGANWHERETHEFLGIRFAGHPNLIPLLLPEDAAYHPLRKDFTP